MSSVIAAWAAVAAMADAIARIGDVVGRVTTQRETRRAGAVADAGSVAGTAVRIPGRAPGGEGRTRLVEVPR